MRSHFGAGRRRVPIVPHVRYATKQRHVSFAPVCTKRRGATCDARNTAAPAPSRTVHCRMFPSCRASVAPRNDDTFPLRPVRTKRRGATCDARKTAAPAPSWTVHCRMFPSCRASVATRDDAMRFHCGGSHCALAGTGRHEWRPYGALPHVPLCRMFVTPRDDDTFPLRPVCTKRRGATPDARNTAASAPSWTVHRRMSTLIYAVNEGHRRKKIGRTLAGSAGMRKFGAAGKFTPEKRHPGRHTQ